jgi:hypothetical protein
MATASANISVEIYKKTKTHGYWSMLVIVSCRSSLQQLHKGSVSVMSLSRGLITEYGNLLASQIGRDNNQALK